MDQVESTKLRAGLCEEVDGQYEIEKLRKRLMQSIRKKFLMLTAGRHPKWIILCNRRKRMNFSMKFSVIDINSIHLRFCVYIRKIVRFSRDNFLNFSFFSYPRGFQHRLAAHMAASEDKPSGYGEENQRKFLGSLAKTGKKMVGVLRSSSLQNRKIS